jgi:hypothetical protein
MDHGLWFRGGSVVCVWQSTGRCSGVDRGIREWTHCVRLKGRDSETIYGRYDVTNSVKVSE